MQPLIATDFLLRCHNNLYSVIVAISFLHFFRSDSRWTSSWYAIVVLVMNKCCHDYGKHCSLSGSERVLSWLRQMLKFPLGFLFFFCQSWQVSLSGYSWLEKCARVRRAVAAMHAHTSTQPFLGFFNCGQETLQFAKPLHC